MESLHLSQSFRHNTQVPWVVKWHQQKQKPLGASSAQTCSMNWNTMNSGCTELSCRWNQNWCRDGKQHLCLTCMECQMSIGRGKRKKMTGFMEWTKFELWFSRRVRSCMNSENETSTKDSLHSCVRWSQLFLRRPKEGMARWLRS